MGWKNLQDMRAFGNRRSARNAKRGLELEDAVEEILGKMVEAGSLSDFIRHAHNSLGDRQGKDFTVRKASPDGKLLERSFGVTVSAKSSFLSSKKHPQYPQWCCPPEMKPETLEKKVLDLFKEQ